MDRVLPAPVNEAISHFLYNVVYPLEKYAAPTVVLVPSVLKSYIEQLSEMTGQDSETLEYLLGLFACYPLGYIMLKLPHGKVKHFFSFFLGAFLLQFTIGVQWVHHLISSLVAYAMLALLPRSVSKTAVPIFAMIYMTMGHLHRQYTNYLGYDLDFTGAQMVLTQKLYSMAYNLYDGELIRKGKEDRAAKRCSEFALDKMPSLIEFLGYTFCFSNVLAGPAYEYKLYERACEGSHLYDKAGKPKGKIPSQFWPTLKPFLISLVCLAIFVVGTGNFPLLDPTNPQTATPVLLTDAILSLPWWRRYGYMWLSLFFVREKYYFAWKNAEGAQNIWYAGFEGFDETTGKEKGWEISNNMDVVEFETAPNLKTLSAVWNKKTALWLSRYVYIRTGGSLMATYGMSAFWHGFYPGYYLFFFSAPLVTMCERLGKKKLSPRFATTGSKWSPWGIVSMISTSLVVEYIVVPFQLLAFDWSIDVWKSHYFIGHVVMAVFYVVVSALPTPKKKEV
jgi:hypothetical protein